jgi:hypothetical protein
MLRSNQRPPPREGSVLFAGDFWRLQNACKSRYFYFAACFKLSGYLLGLLHGCCTGLGRTRAGAPFRGWLPYRYVFSSRMVNPSFLQTRT